MATTHVGSLYFDISIKGIEQVKKQLKSLQIQINELKGKRGVFERLFGGAKGLAGIGTILSSVSRMFTRLGDTLTHFGQITSVFSYRLSILVAGLAAFGVKIGIVATEFEENLAQIGTQLDIRGTELEAFTEELGQNIIDLSKTIPVAANDIARAMYFIVSSMSIPDETAEAMLEPLSKAAVAGRSSVEEMAGAVAVIGNVYDHILVMADGTARFVEREMKGAIALTDATREQVTAAVTHTTDVLFEAVREGRAEVSDYTSQVGDFLQVAAEAGASFEEAMAVYTAMTRVTTASQAATWTANFYRQLLRPDFAETLIEWGIQVERIVEGTGEWATRQRGLNEEEERNLEQIDRKLKGAEGVTGLYWKQKEILEDIGYVQWEISQKDSAARQRRLRELNQDLDITSQQIAFYEEQRGAIGALDQAQVKYWTGAREIRPTLDIFTDLVEKINSATSEQTKLNMITEAFPNIRATQAFLRFIGAYEDIVTWSKEWQEATGQTEEAFAIMADTVNARITILKNNIFALGMAFYLAHEDQIKTFIDGLTTIVMLFQQLDPALTRQIALWGFLLVSLAPIMLLIGTISIGFGTLVTAIGMLISPTVLAPAIVLFAIFGDKLKVAWDALQKYGISDMKDVVQFFMDLAIQLGIISEADAERILIAFGVPLKQMGDPAVLKFIDAFKGMIDRIVTVKDDLVEWFDAFRLLLEDIEKRQGAIGTIVGYIERLAGIVLPFLGEQVTPTRVEVGRYLPGGEAGPEEKAGVLETGIVVGLGTKIVTAILGALGISGGVALTGVIAGAIYTAMHPDEVREFFTVTLPKWWDDTIFPPIRDFFEIELPLFWEIKVLPLVKYHYRKLRIWWLVVGFPRFKKFWKTDLPAWWNDKALPEIKYFFGTTLPDFWDNTVFPEIQAFYNEWLKPWWDNTVLPIIRKFWEEDLPPLIEKNISEPTKNFWDDRFLPWLTSNVLPLIETLLTVTIPNKLGYFLGLILGTGGALALTIGVFFAETLPTWLKDEFAPKFIEVFSTNWVQWLLDHVLPVVAEFIVWLQEDEIPERLGTFFTELIGSIREAFDNFLAGIKKGFLEALYFWMTGGKVKPPTEEEPPPTGPSEFGIGGIVRRTGQVLAHAGEVMFNPRYPRQDLARVVNAAMAKVGGGGELAPVTVTANVNIGTFAGTQTEMNQLQRMLENMSFDMAMRVERKLAEARRVESRRRE